MSAGLSNQYVRVATTMLACTVILASTVVFSGCGIESIVYLADDPVLKSNDDQSAVFRAPETDSEVYRGIEIFYRLYASLTDAESDQSYLSAKQADSTVVPGSAVESYLINTSSMQYSKIALWLLPDGEKIIRIPAIGKSAMPTSAYLASIEFQSASVEPTLSLFDDSAATLAATVYGISRSARGADGKFLSFLDRPQGGDVDYETSSVDTDANEFFVQLYAASYGLNPVDFDDLYGDAVFLGRIKIYF